MLYRSLFPRELSRDLFTDFDRVTRDMRSFFDDSPAIRGLGRGGYPAVNVGQTPHSVEVYVFAPGMAPASIEVNLERGVLTIAGERQAAAPAAKAAHATDDKTTVHLAERFEGRFRRVISLPDDIDPTAVEAKYLDGVLHVSIKRREAAQPRRITVQ